MKEFKPAFLFVFKFLLVYIVGNTLYGLYIQSQLPRPDSVTVWVSNQTTDLLNIFGANVAASENPEAPTVFIRSVSTGHVILNVYEGCNGVNVIIIFLAFIVAFGGRLKNALWFVPAVLIFIHLVNLGRISLLYFTAMDFSEFFYFFHKYCFTAILYIVIFFMWVIWVSRLAAERRNAD